MWVLNFWNIEETLVPMIWLEITLYTEPWKAFVVFLSSENLICSLCIIWNPRWPLKTVHKKLKLIKNVSDDLQTKLSTDSCKSIQFWKGISCDGWVHSKHWLVEIWWIIQIYPGSLKLGQSENTATKNRWEVIYEPNILLKVYYTSLKFYLV